MKDVKPLDISDMTNLAKRLGKKRLENMKEVASKPAYTHPKRTTGRKPKVVLNRAYNIVNEYRYGDVDKWPLFIDEVLIGVSRLDWNHSKPLSTGRMKWLLQSFPILTVHLISYHCNIGERFARDYLTACQISIKWIKKGYDDVNVRGMSYPKISKDALAAQL